MKGNSDILSVGKKFDKVTLYFHCFLFVAKGLKKILIKDVALEHFEG
jgi:hypothetical protein